MDVVLTFEGETGSIDFPCQAAWMEGDKLTVLIGGKEKLIATHRIDGWSLADFTGRYDGFTIRVMAGRGNQPISTIKTEDSTRRRRRT